MYFIYRVRSIAPLLPRDIKSETGRRDFPTLHHQNAPSVISYIGSVFNGVYEYRVSAKKLLITLPIRVIVGMI